nr:MAG TPA: hypothetical protein [Bacteriophage sp.]
MLHADDFGAFVTALFTARGLDPIYSSPDVSTMRKVIGDAQFDRLRQASLLMQVDAFSRLLLKVLGPRVGECVDDLLAPISDEVDGLGEFPNLRALRRVLQSSRERGSERDVVAGLLEGLALSEHDSSPDAAPHTHVRKEAE